MKSRNQMMAAILLQTGSSIKMISKTTYCCIRTKESWIGSALKTSKMRIRNWYNNLASGRRQKIQAIRIVMSIAWMSIIKRDWTSWSRESEIYMRTMNSRFTKKCTTHNSRESPKRCTAANKREQETNQVLKTCTLTMIAKNFCE